ncbi:MAG: cytochrome c3 family protein [Caldilineaceae bacterium]
MIVPSPTWGGLGRGRFVVLLLTCFWLFLTYQAASAQSTSPDSACKLCHVGKGGQVSLPSGEQLNLGVDLTTLTQSVHGSHAGEEVTCTDCHADRRQYRYPHEKNPAQSLQEFRAEISQNCQQCHPQQASAVHNPGHVQAKDNPNVPTCVDCHGGHDAQQADALAADPIGTCQSCHTSYKDRRVGKPHAEVMANLEPGKTCQTCHSDQPLAADAQCKTCHSLLKSDMTLPSGQTVNLHVNAEDVLKSVHGNREIEGVKYNTLQCTDCHQDQKRYGFPHPELDAATRRALTVDMEKICATCHEEIYKRQKDGVHEAAIANGKDEAATCFDCHGNHAIQPPAEPRERISQTCGNCHSKINEQYSTSVHGAALLGKQNPDVPVCTDCHGVHNISDPTTAQFRVNSPDLCAGCHANKELMAKYNISTDVFDTYVADFHGTTVELFEKQQPGQVTNKAVCYDCHGVHNILPASDEHSQVIRENLVTTCQKCHPDANASFPDAWTSHFKPSLQHNPLVYLVNLFYTILIPGVLGGFALFIGSDLFRRFSDRRRKKG